MPSSTESMTRNEIVAKALKRLGATNPSNDEIADGVETLNMKLKEIDAKGKWLWAISNTESTITLSSSTQTYTTGVGAGNISASILELETFSLYIGTQHERCDIITQHQAQRTYLRDDSGKPIAVYLEKGTTMANNKLWVYPTPNGTYTGKYTFRRRLYDFETASDNPDCPQGWELTLVAVLADELAPDFGVSLEERMFLRNDAELKLKERLAQNASKEILPAQKTCYF